MKRYYIRRYRRRQHTSKKKKRSNKKKLRGRGFFAPILATVGTSVFNKILDGIF